MQNLILNHMHKGTIQMMSRTGAVPAVRPKGRSARAPGRPLAKWTPCSRTPSETAIVRKLIKRFNNGAADI